MKSLVISTAIAVAAISALPFTPMTSAPALADQYPAVGHLAFKPKYLMPYKVTSQDHHCEATAESLCSAVHHGAETDDPDASYRAEMLQQYCLREQYKQCVVARVQKTRW